MRKTFLLLAVALATLSISAASLAVTMKNPQNADYMKAEITQVGSVTLEGGVSELNLSIYIPQSDSAQAVEIKEVSNPEYFFEKDKFGNRKLNMFWKNPQNPVVFSVKSIVTIIRKNSGNFYGTGDFSKPTELIQSTDPEIRALAENITFGKKTDFEKIASLTKWVNENIEYDLAYSDVNLSATTVLHYRKGVCDEFSTLLLSMARAIGYQASYAVGYAYGKGYTFSEGDFAPHGWAEIYTPSGTIVSDPTWGEIPVDATHIRFASLAESIYPEVNVSGVGRTPKIKIDPTRTEIRILEARENPILETRSELLEGDIWKGYAVAKTDISAENGICALTRISSQSCTLGGGFLFLPENDSTVYFCGKKTVFSIFGLSKELDPSRRYSCPLTVAAYNGKPQTFSMTLEEKPAGKVKLSLDKTVAEAGERIIAQSPGSYLFTSDGQSGFGSATFTAGDNMVVYAYKEGALEKQEVDIVKEKPFEISMQTGASYTVNDTGFVNITIRNLLQKSRNIVLRFKNNSEQVYLEPLSEKTLSFSFAPQSDGDDFIEAYASGSGFSAYTSRLVEVREIRQPKEWWESIAEGIRGFFKKAVESMASFFGILFSPR